MPSSNPINSFPFPKEPHVRGERALRCRAPVLSLQLLTPWAGPASLGRRPGPNALPPSALVSESILLTRILLPHPHVRLFSLVYPPSVSAPCTRLAPLSPHGPHRPGRPSSPAPNLRSRPSCAHSPVPPLPPTPAAPGPSYAPNPRPSSAPGAHRRNRRTLACSWQPLARRRAAVAPAAAPPPTPAVAA